MLIFQVCTSTLIILLFLSLFFFLVCADDSLLFFRTMENDWRVIKMVLETYAKALRQTFNFHNFTFIQQEYEAGWPQDITWFWTCLPRYLKIRAKCSRLLKSMVGGLARLEREVSLLAVKKY